MNALFPPDGRVTLSQVDSDGSPIKKWLAPDINLKMNIICKTCNSGWMSKMENELAKPAMVDLILGNRIGSFSVKRAHGLSLFAFKTAVISNYSLPQSEWFFTDAERHAFRQSFRIPRDVSMYIFGMENVLGGQIRSFNVKHKPNLSLNVCTFCIGQLGFQVVSAKGSIQPQKFESIPTESGLTTCFYPTIADRFSWPRKKVLGIKAFHDFSLRWNAIRRH